MAGYTLRVPFVGFMDLYVPNVANEEEAIAAAIQSSVYFPEIATNEEDSTEVVHYEWELVRNISSGNVLHAPVNGWDVIGINED